MARPRTFNEAMVLAKARDHFWTHGYSATSIQGLEAVTGLNRSSLYQAFGDKKQLFLLILKNYQQGHQERMANLAASSKTFLEFSQTLLNDILLNHEVGEYPKGCLMINTAMELAECDPEMKAVVESNREAFVQCILPLASTDRSLSMPPREACLYLFGVLAGTHALTQTGLDRQSLQNYIQSSLSVLARR